VPLAEVALERAIALGREYAAEPAKSPTEVESQLCRLTGAQAAAVVHSYSGAIWLTLSALAANREVLVARAEMGDVGSDDSLPKLAAAAHVLLNEVGATNRSSAADFEAAASPRAAAILKLSTDSCLVVGHSVSAGLDELVALARDRELLSLDALGAAPLVNPPASIAWPQRSAQASIAAGVDLAIIRGDGLVNGPGCGILLGNRDVVRRIVAHPLFAAWQLDPLRTAA
jgi:L-seryl-tRNA(Ser) seleniumtransferase